MTSPLQEKTEVVAERVKKKTKPIQTGPTTDIGSSSSKMNEKPKEDMKKKKPTQTDLATDIRKEESDIEMTERESTDVDMKETKGKRESRRRDRKPKSSEDYLEDERRKASSRSSSESSRKRERNSDEKFKLPPPIKESDRERSLRRALEKLKRGEKRSTGKSS